VQQTAPIVQQAMPEEGPRKIVGGTYASWADTYEAAMLTSSDPATVMAWIDANTAQLDKLAKGSPDNAARVSAATKKHIDFLRKTEPKADPISSGPHGEDQSDMGGETSPAPAKPTRGRPKANKAPDFAKDYDGWLAHQLKMIAAAKTPERIEEIFEALDLVWSDLMPPDRETLLGARRAAEGKMEQ